MRFWLVVPALFVMLFAHMSNAMMVKISLEQLVRDAELIVVGKVESVEGHKQEDTIISIAKLKIKKALKGEVPCPELVAVEFGGGQVGEETILFEDSPNYKKGEEVVTFLKKLPRDDIYTTVGLFQGKYVVKDGTVLRERLSLDTFLHKIETILHQTN